MLIKDIVIGENRREVNKDKVKELVESIKLIGLVNPILVDKNNKLIAGHHRLLACKELGYTEINSNLFERDELHAKLAEIDENFVRHELNYIDRGDLIVERENLLSELGLRAESGNNRFTYRGADSAPLQIENTEPLTFKTTKSLAKDIGMSERSLQVESSIAKNLSTEVKQIAKEIQLPKEQAIKLARMKPKEQKKVILRIQSGEAKTVGHALAKNREEAKIKQFKDTVIAPIVALESYKTWLDKQDKCDLLITDPPYITEFKLNEFEEFVKDFMGKCENKVKDTGSMYICIGGYPNELKTYLNTKTKMNLQNVMVWRYDNATSKQPNNCYIQNYQIILYYRWDTSIEINKPSNCLNQMACFTYNAPDGRIGDRYHSWQKPIELAEQLILNSSKSGDTILDPFTCTGTFILAANKLGRIGKGCDISKDNLEIAIKRGCKYE